jgi:hypothetical protein
VEPRRILARRAGLAALAALLVFGASACSGDNTPVGKAPAATVNDSEISQADVVSATEATREFYEYSIKQGQDTDGTLAGLLDALKGDSTHTVGTKGASRILSDMIVDDVIRQALASHDALPTKADRTAKRKEIETSAGGAAALKKFPADYISLYIDRSVLSEAFSKWAAGEADKTKKPLTDKEREKQMRALYEQQNATKPLCLNAIQASTEADATAARARVDGGEDFLAVSKSLVPEGTDFPAEGFVACLGFDTATTAFGQDFSTLAVGDVVGPVSYTAQQGGQPEYYVFRIDGLKGQTYEQMLPQLEQAVPKTPAATDPTTFDASGPLDKLLKKAEIDVNPVFGRWSQVKRTVVPPKVPAPATTTTPPKTVGGS